VLPLRGYSPAGLGFHGTTGVVAWYKGLVTPVSPATLRWQPHTRLSIS